MIKFEPKKTSLKLKRTDSTILTLLKYDNGETQILSIPSPMKIYNINKKIINYSKL
tara:strand:+ start:559 stop:726 length:168 start_codon:yes stop_codon:yes gene_type:complete